MLLRGPSNFLSTHSLSSTFLRNLASNVTKGKHGKKKESKAKVEKVKKEYKAPSKKYQHTLFLPQSTFPLSPARKVEEELDTQRSDAWQNLYSWQRSQPDRTQEFVLHDGPPYANGALHMGHALNKILKDITVRHKLLQGYKVHYVPGWDCHGLPIELKALQHSMGNSPTDAVTIRSRARNFADSCIEEQKKGFLRWGVTADWDNAYVTHSPKFVCRQLRLFTQLYEEGLIFQDHLPVHYSPSSLTTLAESELEYKKDHISPTVLVAFKVRASDALSNLLEGTGASSLHLPIFTTTPWTLPFNKAVCFGEGLSYSVITTQKHGEDSALIWASKLLSEAEKTCGKITVKKTILGEQIPSPLHYSPPFSSTPHPLLPGSHVTDEVGTGLVHTAPAHGKDDHLIGLQYNLDRQSSVTDEGCYAPGVHDSLTGLKVLTEGNETVLELMKAHRDNELLLLNISKIEHSYPYDWRTNEPVIVRASRQWFLKLSLLQEKAKALLSDVMTYPHKEGGMKLLTQQMNRVHWCISRQRVWGTPLPVFYDEGKPLFNKEISEHVLSLMEKHGCDVWWTLPENELLPPKIVDDYIQQGKDLPTKGTDILDVWFDSGCTFTALEGRKADLVIEGSDQFRGWFQSSLLLSVATTGSPSYRNILSHGFTVDENGHKMSKSLGNVISPEIVFEKTPEGGAPLGVDAMRWWAAKQGTDGSHPQCSFPLLVAEANEMQVVRRTVKFLSGCLKDFNSNNSVQYEQLPLLEKFALHRLTKFNSSVWTAYNEYRYHSVVRLVVDYLSTELSQVYFSCIKHRLYCSGTDRHSVQFVLHSILNTVLLCTTPVLPHLTQLLADHQYPGRVLQMETAPPPPTEWWNPEVEKTVMSSIRLREHFNKHHIEEHKKNYRRLRVTVRTMGETYHNLILLQDGCEKSVDSPICEMLGVAEVIIKDDGEEEFNLILEDTNYTACERCRKHRLVEDNNLCTECDSIVNKTV